MLFSSYLEKSVANGWWERCKGAGQIRLGSRCWAVRLEPLQLVRQKRRDRTQKTGLKKMKVTKAIKGWLTLCCLILRFHLLLYQHFKNSFFLFRFYYQKPFETRKWVGWWSWTTRPSSVLRPTRSGNRPTTSTTTRYIQQRL